MHTVALTTPASPPQSPPQKGRWAGPLIVWGVWAVMTAAALGLIALFGSNVPYYDDWDLVDRLTGTQPVTAAWLWELHNSHRLPLPKLLALGLLKLSGVDFRSEMVFSGVLLSAAAAAMIRTARRVRGWTSLTDAFFPLLLLHWGLCRVLLWGWQMHVILPVVLLGVPLLVMVRQGCEPPFPRTVLAGLCVLLLPLSAAHGLAFVPALAVWLGYLAVVYWKAPHPRRRLRGLVVAGLAATAFLLVPLHYLVQYEKEDSGLPFSLRAAVGTTVKFLALDFGPLAKVLWPFSGIAVVGLLAVSGLVLARYTVRKGPAARGAGPKAPPRGRAAERPRALGLLLFLGGIVALAVGFGTGRSYRGNILDEYWVRHYWIFAVPVFYFLYWTWVVYGPPRWRSLVPGLLFAFQLLILPVTTVQGLNYAREMRHDMAAFEQDLVGGQPVFALASRHANTLCPTQTQYTNQIQNDLARRMRDLRDAHIGLFRQLREDRPFAEVNLPVEPSACHEGTWEEGGIFRGSGADSFIEFTLPEPRFVYGIRLKYTYVKTRRMFSEFRVAWSNGPGTPFPEKPQYSFMTYCSWVVPIYHGDGPDECTDPVLIAVQDTVAGFRIYPEAGGPFRFKIQEITLCVPPAGAPTPSPAEPPNPAAARRP